LAQVSPTGYSDFVSPSGRVVRSSSLDRGELVYDSIGLRSGRTLYVIVGDFWIVLVAGALLAAAWLLQGSGRRNRSDRDPA
jgi:apolipoprotein N-acyltransferase